MHGAASTLELPHGRSPTPEIIDPCGWPSDKVGYMALVRLSGAWAEDGLTGLTPN